MVGIFAHDGGAFKPVTSVPVKNGNAWQNAQEVWANNNGVWVKVFPSIVREPAAGENYIKSNTAWRDETMSGAVQIMWGGTQIYDYPTASSSITVGPWTYYRGMRRESAGYTDYYAIYRVGT